MAVLGKHTWSVSAFYKLKLSAGYSCHWHTHTVTRKRRSGEKELAIYIKRLFLFYICWWRSVMIPLCSHILHPTDIRASLFSRNVRNPMGCKPFSSFVSNVSSSIEASAILHPYASYKEKFWCRSLERGAEVGQFSATLTKIGFPLLKKEKSAGVSWPRVTCCSSSRFSSKDYQLFHAGPIVPAELYLYSSTAKAPEQEK